MQFLVRATVNGQAIAVDFRQGKDWFGSCTGACVARIGACVARIGLQYPHNVQVGLGYNTHTMCRCVCCIWSTIKVRVCIVKNIGACVYIINHVRACVYIANNIGACVCIVNNAGGLAAVCM